MKIDKAIILVEVEDKVYQVNLSNNDILSLLRLQSQYLPNGIIPILDKPLEGISLSFLNKETETKK